MVFFILTKSFLDSPEEDEMLLFCIPSIPKQKEKRLRLTSCRESDSAATQ